jgi:hypothetical protein
LNPGRRGGKPATNRLSYGAAITELSQQAKFSYYGEQEISVFFTCI